MRRFLSLIKLSALLLSGCGDDRPVGGPAGEQQPSSISFRQDGTLTFMREDGTEIVRIDIEVAADDSSRTRGLMQRTFLPERSGMLFLMPRVDRHSFWMVNTPLSLDIMFFDADSQLVNVAKYTRPFSQAAVAAERPSLYVVETQAGFADTYGLVPGDRIRWRRTDGSDL
jgi:uncharacterized protein